jgi:hypothetical protein
MSWLFVFFLMVRSARREFGDVNGRRLSARRASEFANEVAFEPALHGTQQEVNSHNSSDGENDLG